MYYEHFGLKEAPFRITPDTRLFYAGGNRGAILDAIVFAVTNGEGIVKVVGEVGSGKTMLCRMLEVRLPDNVDVVYLANPSLSAEIILHAIAFEMKLPVGVDASRFEVMQALQEHLLDKHAHNRQVVVFVEEAQGMPLDTLEEIRLLSNLETQRYKLLQIVLFGQPELEDNLSGTSIRQLKERITHSFDLPPFTRDDVGQYLDFRMRAAGYRGPSVFTRSAVRAVAHASEGLIRRTNILADKALLAAYAEDAHQVSRRHVRAAVRDSEFGARRSPGWPWLGAVAGVIGVLVVGGAYRYVGNARFAGDDRPASPAGELFGDAGAPGTLRDAQRIDGLSPLAAVEPVPVVTVSTALDLAGEAIQTSPPVPERKKEPGASSPSADPGNPGPGMEVAPAAPVPVRAEPVAVVREMAKPVMVPRPGMDYVSRRLAATHLWLDTAEAGHFSIQLMLISKERGPDLKKNLLEMGLQEDALGSIYAYHTQIRGEDLISILLGEFADFATAEAVLNTLPAALQASQPFIRNVRDIQGGRISQRLGMK